MIVSFLLVIAFALLVVGSYTDLRTREVPDWVNYSGIFIGLGLRGLLSIGTLNSSHFIEGLVGFGAFFIVAIAMFYLGQWGGGDSKTIMALGALLGMEFHLDNLAVAFIINSVFIGAIYGLVWLFVFAVKRRKRFIHMVQHLLRKKDYRLMQYGVLVVSVLIIAVAFLTEQPNQRLSLFILGFFFFGMFYLFIFTKAVEMSCMLKRVSPEKLTDGDWIAKEIKFHGRHVTGPKDLGVERGQIKKLINLKKRHIINSVLVKEGMPFIPNFLIAFIVTILWGNLILFVI